MRHRRVWLGLIVLSLLVTTGGCVGSFSGEEERTTAHMYAHFGRLGQIQTAVIEGDLAAARQAARALAEHDPSAEFPATLDSYEAELKNLAAEAGDAPTLATAADLTARMASTCGACHTAYEGGPRMDIQSGPPEGPETVDQMLRHLWGADRMWEGLLVPSEELWLMGARVLAQDGLWDQAVLQDSEEASRLAERVRRVGRVARLASTDARRADLYGDLLETCSGCHQLTGTGRAGVDH